MLLIPRDSPMYQFLHTPQNMLLHTMDLSVMLLIATLDLETRRRINKILQMEEKHSLKLHLMRPREQICSWSSLVCLILM
jgi:hypothetical protein